MIRIKKWWDKFENSGSRKLKNCSYFSAPSGTDSKGYRKLMRQGAPGVIAFGVFQSLCQVMPTLSQEARKAGEMRNSDGTLMDEDDLCDLTRLPEEILRPAIELLESVGWLEEIGSAENQGNPEPRQLSAKEIPSSADNLPPVSQDPPSKFQDTPSGEESRGGEGKGEERNSCPMPSDACPPPADVVAELWPLFPKVSRERSSKRELGEEWKRIKAADRPSLDMLKAALAAWCQTEKWRGGYAEGAHRWVKRRQWESPPEPETPRSSREADIGGRTASVARAEDLAEPELEIEIKDECPL
ncbi:hypothetical protein [Roseibacillus ishigakijimensis]|uniref:Uncharacterized protein n=1 Tax=Roseibacillus ishigakijimensis TaxID=454146 RepID=A0A934RSV1_9BACT|nr:hypothetical protein [Roseibacillus ishigakijimensis]MBK1835031.1 hypothetical protein [Roseibacillus ishigakijimensis]